MKNRKPLDQAGTARILGSDRVTDGSDRPAVTWAVVVRRTRDTAKEFATEWVEYHGCYDARVVDSAGVTVWRARESGVRYNPKLGGKRRRRKD